MINCIITLQNNNLNKLHFAKPFMRYQTDEKHHSDLAPELNFCLRGSKNKPPKTRFQTPLPKDSSFNHGKERSLLPYR